MSSLAFRDADTVRQGGAAHVGEVRTSARVREGAQVDEECRADR
jgi:hypothetical protein